MANKIKVIQLITTMADGGAETLVKDYALLCDKEKYDIQIVTWSEPLGSANESILKKAGIPIIHLGAKAVEHPTSNPVVRAYRKINKYMVFRKLVVSGKVDVIHIHLRVGRFLRFIPDKVLKKIKLVYTLHNEPSKYFDPNGSGKKLFEYKELKKLIDRYDLTVVALHDDMNRQVKELFDTQRVITVKNGINFDRFDRALYDPDAIRLSLGIDKETKLIGHVGSYTEQKNHHFLLQAFEAYSKKNGNAKLLLVGKGVLKEKINDEIKQRGLEEKVISLENRSDIPELMSIMDVFALPSRWEGFPIVLIEAQKIGLPCVISNRINQEVVLSENVIMLDIEDDINRWTDAFDGIGDRMSVVSSFEDYDIKKSIEHLQRLYSGDGVIG